MAIEYDLTLAGDTPVNRVAERALPDPEQRPTGVPQFLSTNLDEQYGFAVTVVGGSNRYIDAESDSGTWEWEPQDYVLVGFRLDKSADREWAVANMLTIVRRVLATGSEDTALVINGDLLLLARFDGKLIKHNRDRWWSSYPAADQLIPG